MDFEDFTQPEVGIAAAVTAVVASPQLRRVVRRGAVLGIAGVLMAGDAVTSFARGLSHGAQAAMSGSANGAKHAEAQSTQRGQPVAHSTDEPAEGSPTVDAAGVTEEPAPGYSQEG
jgi:uncharacterized protein (DUF1786 family)